MQANRHAVGGVGGGGDGGSASSTSTDSNQHKGRVERTFSAPSTSHQLDKQMENLCLAMTEKALNN